MNNLTRVARDFRSDLVGKHSRFDTIADMYAYSVEQTVANYRDEDDIAPARSSVLPKLCWILAYLQMFRPAFRSQTGYSYIAAVTRIIADMIDEDDIANNILRSVLSCEKALMLVDQQARPKNTTGCALRTCRDRLYTIL